MTPYIIAGYVLMIGITFLLTSSLMKLFSDIAEEWNDWYLDWYEKVEAEGTYQCDLQELYNQIKVEERNIVRERLYSTLLSLIWPLTILPIIGVLICIRVCIKFSDYTGNLQWLPPK